MYEHWNGMETGVGPEDTYRPREREFHDEKSDHDIPIDRCRAALSASAMELLSISQRKYYLELARIAKGRAPVSRRECLLKARAWGREIFAARRGQTYSQPGFLMRRQAGAV